MPTQNIRNIKQVINNPALAYGVLRSNKNLVMPLEIDDDGNILINDQGSGGGGGGSCDGQIFLSAQGGIPRTDNGCGSVAQLETTTHKINYYYLPFDKDSDEYAQWVFVMPSDWDEDTITATLYWTAATATGGTVEFVIKAGCYGDDDALDTALGAGQTCTDTWIANEDVHVSAESSAITVANAGASRYIVIEAMRDVSEDNLDNDCLLLGIMIAFGRS